MTFATPLVDGGVPAEAEGHTRFVSDIEHEMVMEEQRLRERIQELSELARKSLTTAIAAQDHAFVTHDGWLDDALDDVAGELVGGR